MSLALLEGYSSAEEEDDRNNDDGTKYQISSDSDSEELPKTRQEAASSVFSFPKQPPSGSSLPSVFDAFSEVTGPPQFLNNSVEEQASARQAEQQPPRHGRRRNRRENRDLPAGAVVQAKAQLVGVHERVRSDITGATTSAIQTKKDLLNTTPAEGKRVVTAANPNAEDAAELLRMCLQCGIPKTFSSARGMVCPVCGDRPPADPTKESDKKKGSTVKDKEKSKRMRGQSSHATWKSETEMQLRQHFD